MTAPQPGPHPPLDPAIAALVMQVDRDTVLQARAALLGESLRLKNILRIHSINPSVGLCGGDPVSSDAAPAFNERIGVLITQCRQYTEVLEGAGHTLGEIARRYGFTDAQIASSFHA